MRRERTKLSPESKRFIAAATLVQAILLVAGTAWPLIRNRFLSPAWSETVAIGTLSTGMLITAVLLVIAVKKR
jgi:hypothetical protein